MTDIMTPTLGESVTEATVARWAKKPGDAVPRDEVLVELETDKVNLEVAAPEDGVLTDIAADEGDDGRPGPAARPASARRPRGAAQPAAQPAAPPQPPSARRPRAPTPPPQRKTPPSSGVAGAGAARAPRPRRSPISRRRSERIVAENALDPAAIAGTGKDGRITKGDALAALEARAAAGASAASRCRSPPRRARSARAKSACA